MTQQQQQLIYKGLKTALSLDDGGKQSEAFVQYLCCLDLISDELRATVIHKQQQQADTLPKLFQLSRQCIDRCEAIFKENPHLFNTLMVKRTSSMSNIMPVRTYTPEFVPSAPPPASMYPALPQSNLYTAIPMPHFSPPMVSSFYSAISVPNTTNQNVPILERFSAEEHEQLAKQFAAMGAQNGAIALKAFGESMGTLFVRSGIVEHLFQMFDINNSGAVELADLKYAYGVMTRGTAMEKANCMFLLLRMVTFLASWISLI